MNNALQLMEIGEIIKARRTIKPDKMNGKLIADETILELLADANWAPTHARTEPWRFIVFSNNKTKEFALRHANLYKEVEDPSKFTQQKYDNLVKLGQNVSHIIIVWMKRIENHKIPVIEEVCATAAATENLLLSATAKRIATFWSTSGMTHHPVLHSEFNLGEEDKILGILYLGYTDEPFREGTRMIPLSDKIEWIK
jgi:nitroreductase